MRQEDMEFMNFVRSRVTAYKKSNNLTHEQLAEHIHVSSRASYSQAGGEYGYSAKTLAFFLSCLPQTEREAFFNDLRKLAESGAVD